MCALKPPGDRILRLDVRSSKNRNNGEQISSKLCTAPDPGEPPVTGSWAAPHGLFHVDPSQVGVENPQYDAHEQATAYLNQAGDRANFMLTGGNNAM